MHFIRRILYVPLLLVVAGALLAIFGVISLDIELPVSFEVIAAIAGGLLGVMFLADMRLATSSWQHPEPEDPPKSDAIIYPKPLDDMADAVETMEKAEDYVAKANGRVKIAIDIEDPEEGIEDAPEDDA